jgi:hypothetical protein
MKQQKGSGDKAMVDATRLIKEQAAKQPVRIELTEDQLASLRSQWGKANPASPVEITFFVSAKRVGELKVASCAYIGDTCCA